MVNDVTPKVLQIALQAKQHGGSNRMRNVLIKRTNNRDDKPHYDCVTSYDRSQGRYQLRPSAQNRIISSIEGGNQFAALALLVLANTAQEEAETASNATYLAPEPQF